MRRAGSDGVGRMVLPPGPTVVRVEHGRPKDAAVGCALRRGAGRRGPRWLAPYQVGDVLALGTPDVTVRVLSQQGDGSMTVRVERR